MASGSKYETMANAIKQKIEALNSGVADVVKQKQLEAELNRIDEETEQTIKEIKAQPINRELLKQQAKQELESKKKLHARTKLSQIAQAEAQIEDLKASLKQAEQVLSETKEMALEREERNNLLAQQEYEQILSSVDNTEQTINLRVEKIRQEANARKKDIQIRLSNIKIMNEAQSDKVKCIDQLYNDIKEISLKLGDGSK